MARLRIALWVWLLAGAGLLAHDAATGGGLAGWLMLQQLDRFAMIAPGLTYAAIGLVLVAVPAYLLLPPRGRRADIRSAAPATRRLLRLVTVSLGACMAVFSVLAYQQAAAIPTETSPLVRFTIFGTAASVALPPDARVTLQGVPQLAHAVSYDELTLLTLHADLTEAHRFVPMTGVDWNGSQPVSYVTDLGESTTLSGAALPGTQLRGTLPGIIVAESIPGWLRQAFAERGVTLSADARLHVTDWRAERNGWYVVTAVTGLIAVLCILLRNAAR